MPAQPNHIGLLSAFVRIGSTASMSSSRLRSVPKHERVYREHSCMQLRNARANFWPVVGVQRKRFSVWASAQLM